MSRSANQAFDYFVLPRTSLLNKNERRPFPGHWSHCTVGRNHHSPGAAFRDLVQLVRHRSTRVSPWCLLCLPGRCDGSQCDTQVQEEVRDHSPLQANLTLRTKAALWLSIDGNLDLFPLL